jgi:hypothetical protein
MEMTPVAAAAALNSLSAGIETVNTLSAGMSAIVPNNGGGGGVTKMRSKCILIMVVFILAALQAWYIFVNQVLKHDASSSNFVRIIDSIGNVTDVFADCSKINLHEHR